MFEVFFFSFTQIIDCVNKLDRHSEVDFINKYIQFMFWNKTKKKCLPLLTPFHRRFNAVYFTDVSVIYLILIMYLLFRWLNPLFSKGYGKTLEADDLFDVCPSDQSNALGDKLER